MSPLESKRAYALVTAARNEERNLVSVARGIINQTVRPSLWVIVDDGSLDGSPQIIEDLGRQWNWILAVRLPESPRDTHLHYAEICMKGFDFAIGYLDEKRIEYGFLGLIDADTVVEPTYFEKLMNEFEKNRSLGLASGGLFYESHGRLLLENSERNSPRGTGRLWTKKCFLDTGGYLACQAPPDAISNARAKLLGYGVGQFPSVVAIQLRTTSSAEGVWSGYEKRGRSWYHLNAHPALILMNMALFTISRPRSRGLAFFLGYFAAFISRETKIEDEEIRQYFWSRRPFEVIRATIGKPGT